MKSTIRYFVNDHLYSPSIQSSYTPSAANAHFPVLLNAARDPNETNKEKRQRTDVLNTAREYKERSNEELRKLGLEFELGLGLRLG